MSCKIFSYQYDLLDNSGRCFYTDLCSLGSVVGFFLGLVTSPASTSWAPHPGFFLPNFDHISEATASNLLHQAKRNIQHILLEVTWVQIEERDSSDRSHSRADSTSLAGAIRYISICLSACRLSNHHGFPAAVSKRLELKTTKMQTPG